MSRKDARPAMDFSPEELIAEALRRAPAPDWEQPLALKHLSNAQLAAVLADRLSTLRTALEGATEPAHAFSNDHSN